jgi:hypothetical protein
MWNDTYCSKINYDCDITLFGSIDILLLVRLTADKMIKISDGVLKDNVNFDDLAVL